MWLPPLAVIIFIGLLALGGEPLRDALRYERADIIGGEYWRLLSGNFVHLSPWHAFLNGLGVLVLVLLCPETLPWQVWLRRLLFLSMGMTLGLFFLVPDAQAYVGLSGVIHGLFVLGLMPQVLKKDLIALGCLLYLLGKIGYEMFAGAPVSDEAALGGKVLVESHLFGTLSAFLYGFIFRTYTRVETFSLRK
ncbi:MAG: rhombosortase [Pseudomonadota bacterium]|mgnify:CR=1 FL=1